MKWKEVANKRNVELTFRIILKHTFAHTWILKHSKFTFFTQNNSHSLLKIKWAHFYFHYNPSLYYIRWNSHWIHDKITAYGCYNVPISIPCHLIVTLFLNYENETKIRDIIQLYGCIIWVHVEKWHEMNT